MKTTHEFDSTGSAYDATQCDDNVRDGDILVIESEQVVGVAYTWPIAVTEEHGNLHYMALDSTIQDVANNDPVGLSANDYTALVNGYFTAQLEAVARGWDIVEIHAQKRIDYLNEYIQNCVMELDSEIPDHEQKAEIRKNAELMMKNRDTLEKALYQQQGRETRQQLEDQEQAELSISNNYGDCGRAI